MVFLAMRARSKINNWDLKKTFQSWLIESRDLTVVARQCHEGKEEDSIILAHGSLGLIAYVETGGVVSVFKNSIHPTSLKVYAPC